MKTLTNELTETLDFVLNTIDTLDMVSNMSDSERATRDMVFAEHARLVEAGEITVNVEYEMIEQGV